VPATALSDAYAIDARFGTARRSGLPSPATQRATYLPRVVSRHGPVEEKRALSALEGGISFRA
jgi:hypothetical protein